MEDQLRRVMADVLDLDPDAIDGGTTRDSVESWDSLKHIMLCLALEEEFKVSFDVHEIEAMMSYDDMVQVLQQKR
jgi:acyl carrier protein